MGIAKQLKEEARSKPRTKLPQEPVQRIWSFNPSKDQKEEIRALDVSLEDAFSFLCDRVEELGGFTLFYSAKTHAFSAVMREHLDDWQKAKAVSVWHSMPDRAVIGLYYYLKHVNPDWPSTSPVFERQAFDW